MRRTLVAGATLVALATTTAALAAGGPAREAQQPPPLPVGGEPVRLDPADFTTRIDNPWWPMAPGSRWTYRETTGDGPTQRVVVTVLRRTRRVAGIEARVVLDEVRERGQLVEKTYDWYAQDRHGTIWYLGEDTTEFEDGRPVSKQGSWEAGVDGAQAGVVMPGRPEPGQRYRQEYREGEAEDEGRVLSVDEMAQTPLRYFRRALLTRDSTPIEPRVLEYKLYARGVGPVLVLDASGGQGREELLRFRRGRQR